MHKVKKLALSFTAAALVMFTAHVPQLLAATVDVSMADNAFNPPAVTVTQGDTVTWTNNHDSDHVVIANNGEFNSATMTPDSTYSFVFTTPGTYNYHGNTESMVGTITVQAATSTPSVPTNLTATSTSTSTIDVSWTASTDPDNTPSQLMYEVFRNGTQVATTTAGTVTFTDTGLTASTTYTYAVAASDPDGNMSAQTATVSATTLAEPPAEDETAPSAPTNLTASSSSPSTVDLSWTASTDNVGVIGYSVFRDGTSLATTTTTNYQDTNLTPSTTYSYAVTAYDAAGNSSVLSSSTSITTMASGTPTSTIPSIPLGLTASSTSSSTIQLSWMASTDSDNNASDLRYIIYRNNTNIATTATGTLTYLDTGLASSTTYTYTVAAMDPNGNMSAQSASTTATTQGPAPARPPLEYNMDTVFGWLVLPTQIANYIFSTSSATTTPTSTPYTYINGYPTINGNYYTCQGTIDNDMSHHTTDPRDTDPAHHVGQNCPGGAPLPPVQTPSGVPGGSMHGPWVMFNLMTGSGNEQWTIIPLTGHILEKLQEMVTFNSNS